MSLVALIIEQEPHKKIDKFPALKVGCS